MKQGQICKIQVHEGQDPLFSEHIGKDGGWFLKAKGKNGKVMFHLVDWNRTMEMSSPLDLVDESLKNENPTKPYYVVFIVPENLQPLVTSISTKMDSMATQTCAEAKVNSLYEAKAIAATNLENAKKKVALHEARIKEIEHEIDELFKISAMEVPHFMYAYGKHTEDGQEYCWRIPFELYKTIHAGSTIVVKTKKGEDKAVVTKVEKSPYLLDHKLVVSMA